MYDVEAFKSGRETLKQFEVDELGDVAGRSLLHLQCHFGLDTLSWARRGAHVTGADFSPKAVDKARTLAADLLIDATFVCSDLYELPGALTGTFDIVYTSFGAIYWLPDIEKWADVVAHFLVPTGTFYIAEFHPFAWAFDDTDASEPVLRYPYFDRQEPLALAVHGSYADPKAETKTKVEYGWPHGLGSIVTALVSRGLDIEFLHEFPFTVFPQLPFLVKSDNGYWTLPPEVEGEIPLMFSIKAKKRALS